MYKSALSAKNISMLEVEDLIDMIWTSDRPLRPNGDLIIHTLDYTGQYKVLYTAIDVAASTMNLYFGHFCQKRGLRMGFNADPKRNA